MSESQDPGSDQPFVEATLRYKMPLPEGTTEEEALEAAEAEFSDVRESDDASLELRYVDTDSDTP